MPIFNINYLLPQVNQSNCQRQKTNSRKFNNSKNIKDYAADFFTANALPQDMFSLQKYKNYIKFKILTFQIYI